MHLISRRRCHANYLYQRLESKRISYHVLLLLLPPPPPLPPPLLIELLLLLLLILLLLVAQPRQGYKTTDCEKASAKGFGRAIARLGSANVAR